MYNRTTETTTTFAEATDDTQDVRATETIEEFVAALDRPRRILLLVKAGVVVDKVIEQLLPHLEENDIIVDLGNSLFTDTERRAAELESTGVRFVGSGVSGGEEGARNGPSIMPGGDATAWPELQDIFEAIAAKAGPGGDEPATSWIGPGGSGHYVKMVHNGICLLYTSPSPRDQRGSRMPSSA